MAFKSFRKCCSKFFVCFFALLYVIKTKILPIVISFYCKWTGFVWVLESTWVFSRTGKFSWKTLRSCATRWEGPTTWKYLMCIMSPKINFLWPGKVLEICFWKRVWTLLKCTVKQQIKHWATIPEGIAGRMQKMQWIGAKTTKSYLPTIISGSCTKPFNWNS